MIPLLVAASLLGQIGKESTRKLNHEQCHEIYCVASEAFEWADCESQRIFPPINGATDKARIYRQQAEQCRQVFRVAAEAAILRRFRIKHDRLERIWREEYSQHGTRVLNFNPPVRPFLSRDVLDHFDPKTVRLPAKAAKAYGYKNPPEPGKEEEPKERPGQYGPLPEPDQKGKS